MRERREKKICLRLIPQKKIGRSADSRKKKQFCLDLSKERFHSVSSS